VPLFTTLTSGTLCGRWPDIGLWPIVLSLADKHGTVDVTPDFIARITGLAVDDVTACMARFCQPDPHSRSTDAEGRRLERLEADRAWGWRIVNHAKYRERARLLAKNAAEVGSGRNAERMRDRQPVVTAGDRRSPPKTDPSDADTDANAKREGRGEGSLTLAPPQATPADARKDAQAQARAARIPLPFEMTDARREVGAQYGITDVDIELRKFVNHFKAASGQNARKLDWDATWENWCIRAGEDARRHQARQADRPLGRADAIRQRQRERDLAQREI